MNEQFYIKWKEYSSRNIFGNMEANGINILWVRLKTNSDNKHKVNMKMHKHTFFELHIQLDGFTEYCFGTGESITVKKGEYLLIPPGIRHRLSGEGDGFRKMSVTFSCEDGKMAKYSFKNETFCGDASAWLPVILDSLYIGMTAPPGADELIIQNTISSIILLVCDRVACDRRNTSEKIDERFSTARRLIEDNSDRVITVSEVAAYVNISIRQLERLFLKYEHMSVCRFIELCRCDRAKELLCQCNVSIPEISERMDFSNEFNFMRFFKRVEGITPSVYRNMTGNKKQ